MKKLTAILLAIFALNASALLPFTTPAWADEMNGDDKITIIDPGHNGNSNFLLVQSNGKYGLLDAGTNGSQAAYEKVTSYLKAEGIAELEFIFVSHRDTDHVSTISGVYGNETRLIYDDFKVKRLYTADVEDSRNYTIAARLNTTGEAFYEHQTRIYNDLVTQAQSRGVEVTVVTQNFAYDFGDFTIDILNTQPADTDEQGNYWNNLDSMVQLIRKKDSNGEEYNMLVTNDLEGYDVDEVIAQLQALGVTRLDAWEFPHHGHSMYQSQRRDILNTFGAPITGVTYDEQYYADTRANWYAELQADYAARGLYWQGSGEIQFDFSNLDENGLTVSQIDNALQSVVSRNNGAQTFSQNRLATAPTLADFTTDKMRAQTASSQENSNNSNEAQNLSAPNTGLMDGFFEAVSVAMGSLMMISAGAILLFRGVKKHKRIDF